MPNMPSLVASYMKRLSKSLPAPGWGEAHVSTAGVSPPQVSTLLPQNRPWYQHVSNSTKAGTTLKQYPSYIDLCRHVVVLCMAAGIAAQPRAGPWAAGAFRQLIIRLTVAAHLLGGGGCAFAGGAPEHPDAAHHDVVQPGAVLPAGLDVAPKARPKDVCAGTDTGLRLPQRAGHYLASDQAPLMQCLRGEPSRSI
jgi:hypothetical protein